MFPGPSREGQAPFSSRRRWHRRRRHTAVLNADAPGNSHFWDRGFTEVPLCIYPPLPVRATSGICHSVPNPLCVRNISVFFSHLIPHLSDPTCTRPPNVRGFVDLPSEPDLRLHPGLTWLTKSAEKLVPFFFFYLEKSAVMQSSCIFTFSPTFANQFHYDLRPMNSSETAIICCVLKKLPFQPME